MTFYFFHKIKMPQSSSPPPKKRVYRKRVKKKVPTIPTKELKKRAFKQRTALQRFLKEQKEGLTKF